MMAGIGGASSSNPNPAPKILLAKPGLVTSGKFNRGGGSGGGDDDSAALRSRLPAVGSLNLLSESWDFHIDRFLPFLTDNTEFTVVGVIGPPGVGKSIILNEIYGFDSSSPRMLPPFALESEETKVMDKHCTVGIEPRVSSERIILLDTQPVFSPSVLAEMIRPDGSSTIAVVNGEPLSAELAHEMMSVQVRHRLRKDYGIEGGIPLVFSLEKPKVKLLPFKGPKGGEENPSDYQVVPGFRVRIIPVLGTIPAIFGQVMASYVVTQLAGLHVPMKPVVNFDMDHYRVLHQRLIEHAELQYGTTEQVQVDV